MNTIAQPRPATASPLTEAVMIAAVVGLLVAGGYVLAQLMSVGHAAYNSDSRGIFWGLPIITYDFFLIASTGMAMLTSAWTVFGLRSFEPFARRALWLAVAALVGGVAALLLELGAPLRALVLIPTSFQTAAPLFWKVWGLIVYALALAWLVLKWLRAAPDAPVPKTAATVALVAAAGITFVAGGVYGWMAMRPVWYGGEVSLAFIVEALLAAVSLLIVFTHLAHGFDGNRIDGATRSTLGGALGSLFAVLIVAHALFVAARLVAGLWSNADGMQVWQHLWRQAGFQAVLWIGIGVPLVLTVVPSLRKSLSLQLAAAAITIVALFAARYDFVIGGQMVAPFKGSWAPALLDYAPSATEWSLLAMAAFIVVAIAAAGEKFIGLGSRQA